jgi:Ca2+-binding RTX toxin-like protein
MGVAALLLVWASLVSAASAADPTCAGETATIVGTDGDDDLTGTGGDDVVSLGPGYDTFRGGAGNDIVCGGPGQDSLHGEEGDDWLDGEDDADYNVVGGPGDDVVHGGPGDDRRLSGDDFGEDGGDDRVYGDAGDDAIRGEPGGGADLVDGGPGTDVISFYLSGRSVDIDVAAGTATGDAVDSLSGLEAYSGSEYDDVLTGSSGADRLDGVYGDDEVLGRGGDDTLTATAGTIRGGSGRDTFVSADEATAGLTVSLGRGADRAVLVGTWDTTVLGGPGDDVVEVPPRGPGVDTLVGVRLRGGRGDDRLTFAHNTVRVRIDLQSGTARWPHGRIDFRGVNEFHGSEQADTLRGSRRSDRMFGRGGNDVLRGLAGPDLLRGGGGRDTAYGGPGRDRCSAERRFSC